MKRDTPARPTGIWMALLTLLVLLTCAPALGDELDNQLELNEEALAAAADKDYERAIALLRDSLALGELNVTWLNLGRVYFLTGHCRQALEAYDRASRAPPVEEPPPEVVAGALRRYMDDMEARCLGTVTVTCEPASMRLSAGGRPRRCGEPMSLVIGRVKLRGALDDQVVERSIEVKTGTNPPVTLHLPRRGLDEDPPEGQSEGGGGLAIAGWVVGGLGLTAALTGVGLRVGLGDDLDELDRLSGTLDGDLERFETLKESVESRQTTAFALIGAGGALVATSAVLLWLGAESDSAPSASGAWRLHIGALGLSVERRF